LEDGSDIKTLNEREMAKFGWVRKQETK